MRSRQVGFAIALLTFFVVLQFSTDDLGSVDGYFHARYSAIVWQGGLRAFPPPFPWLPLTIRSLDRYYDHHLLFHVLLAPFVAGSALQGAKLASALFGGVAVLAVYAMLHRRRVAGAEWWVLGMFALAPDFLLRMEMPRAQSLSLICLLGTAEIALRARFVWLVPLAALYTWLYDAFPLLILVAAFFGISIATFERRFEWRLFLFPPLGVLIGLVLNPYFPNNAHFILEHYLGKWDIDPAMRFGLEWYPYPLAATLGWNGAAVIFAAAALAVWRIRYRLDAAQLALLLTAGFFSALTWRSRRFVEYAPPFLVIALAGVLGDFVIESLRRRRKSTRVLLALLLAIGCCNATIVAARRLREGPPPDRYAGAAAWLSQHTPSGEIVFTPDWDDFPLLFFHDQQNRYVVGLDPSYLQLRDQDLFALWERLGRGELPHLSRVLDQFQSRVVLADHGRRRFIQAMDDDPQMFRVYEDRDCVIFVQRLR